MIYDENYYNSNNYHNYHEREDRYYRLAKELETLLLSISSIKPYSRILDYGCAVGFLMEGFTKLGYKHVHGYDISEYCKEVCLNKGLSFAEKLNYNYDIMFTLDVLEHMTDNEIIDLFEKTKTKILIGRIPVAAQGEDNFHLEISRQDVSHINCKNKVQWNELLKFVGFDVILPLNLYSIYDSPGVFSFMAIKKFG